MTAANIRVCAVIPSYNHWQAMPAIVERLRTLGLAVFVIDDGSAAPAQAALAALNAPQGGVQVRRLEVNRGKGGAVLEGFALARAAGFSHCVQVDADGQHDMAAVTDMLALARQHPDAIIAGQAAYDDSAPLGRVVGRWITHVCVWIETLSFDVHDSMCGLRVYPVAAIAALLDRGGRIGQGMDFDIEILVRLHRAGTPGVNHPVSVTYPPGNLSNFRMWRDNWHITKMHTRLIAGTLVSLPVVLWRRSRRAGTATHWAGLGERGMYWGLQGSAWAYRLLGRRGCMAMLAPVVLYFYLTAGERRRASLDFLRRAFAASGRARPPGWWEGYRHFLSFARRALDSFVAWMGRMPADAVRPMEVAALEEAKAQPRGAIFIVSHHGNVEVSRALLDPGTRRRVVVLTHTRHAETYNRILREFNPAAAVIVAGMRADTHRPSAADRRRRLAVHCRRSHAGQRKPADQRRAVSRRGRRILPGALSDGGAARLSDLSFLLPAPRRSLRTARRAAGRSGRPAARPAGRSARPICRRLRMPSREACAGRPVPVVQLLRLLAAGRPDRPSMISTEVTIRTQFYDLDPMNIVWHGNYVRYLEQARAALLGGIGFGYREMKESGFAWPIVDLSIRYVRPLQLNQDFVVRATLTEYENRLCISYRVLDAASRDVLTKARTVQVAVSIESGELSFESPPQLIACVRSHL
jgi:YbgC/YbaW family acyl-CoA thioester hydrolase